MERDYTLSYEEFRPIFFLSARCDEDASVINSQGGALVLLSWNIRYLRFAGDCDRSMLAKLARSGRQLESFEVGVQMEYLLQLQPILVHFYGLRGGAGERGCSQV